MLCYNNTYTQHSTTSQVAQGTEEEAEGLRGPLEQDQGARARHQGLLIQHDMLYYTVISRNILICHIT